MHLDFVATNEAEFAVADKETRKSLLPAFLPMAYIEQPLTRIQAYKKLSGVNSPQELDLLRKAWRDRFGVLPKAVEHLLLMAEIKLAASSRKIVKLEVKEGKLILTRGGDFILINGKFPRLVSGRPVAMLNELAGLIKNF
jgi:transcription-repair coupling factor (superfamily II helicase)